jgi:DNA-binding NtrC family response regulator
MQSSGRWCWASGDLIRPEDLPETLVERGAGLGMATSNFEMAKKQCRKQIVLHYLDRAEGKQSEAAKLLGILPQNLRRMIRDEKIDIKERRVCPLYSAGR